MAYRGFGLAEEVCKTTNKFPSPSIKSTELVCLYLKHKGQVILFIILIFSISQQLLKSSNMFRFNILQILLAPAQDSCTSLHQVPALRLHHHESPDQLTKWSVSSITSLTDGIPRVQSGRRRTQDHRQVSQPKYEEYRASLSPP